MSKMNLICFPYAGGSSHYYSKWKNYLAQFVDIVGVELAGRGRRMNEPLYADFEELITDAYHFILPYIAQGNYAFFGHSMGATICIEIAQRIYISNGKGPRHIFFSGKGVPGLPGKNEKLYHKMSVPEFKRSVVELGGISEDLLENPIFDESFFPVLKNDFRITEIHPNKEFRPIPASFTILYGRDEQLSYEQISGWKKLTTGDCFIRSFSGGHFFIDHYDREITDLIKKRLEL